MHSLVSSNKRLQLVTPDGGLKATIGLCHKIAVMDSCLGELTMLTAKQRTFVREYIAGKSQTDAYRAAYSTANMRGNSVRREASRLMTNPTITTIIKSLEAEADAVALSKRIATREEVLNQLTHYMNHGQTGDAVRVRAAELLGKHYGLFLDKASVEKPQRSSEEIKKELTAALERIDWIEIKSSDIDRSSNHSIE